MRKRRMHASLILMALCIYLQWGRGVSVRNTISSSRDGKRTEHITIVANKLYIGDKEAFAGDMIETCINNEFRDIRWKSPWTSIPMIRPGGWDSDAVRYGMPRRKRTGTGIM